MLIVAGGLKPGMVLGGSPEPRDLSRAPQADDAPARTMNGAAPDAIPEPRDSSGAYSEPRDLSRAPQAGDATARGMNAAAPKDAAPPESDARTMNGAAPEPGAAPEALPLALAGRVYCYVDATENAVEVGDLLTTSNTPGYAMKAADQTQAFGAVIGKATEPLPQGEQGLILVLVNLQ